MSIPQTAKSINGSTEADFFQAPKQLRLWDEPSMDTTQALKTAMRQALEACSLSREKIVADMNRLAAEAGMTCGGRGQKVTIEMLHKWCAPGSPEHVIKVTYLTLFCHAVGSFLPFQALLSPLKAMAIFGADLKFLELGKLQTAKRKLDRDYRRLNQEVDLP